MKSVCLILSVLLLTGCAETIVMKNPKTGEVAQCRPDSMDWVPQHAAETCATGYEKAGWVRMQ